MKSLLVLNCDNAAFGDEHWEAAHETARILEAIANSLREIEGYGRTFETLRDSIGYDVGRFCLKAEGDPGYQDLARGITYRD